MRSRVCPTETPLPRRSVVSSAPVPQPCPQATSSFSLAPCLLLNEAISNFSSSQVPALVMSPSCLAHGRASWVRSRGPPGSGRGHLLFPRTAPPPRCPCAGTGPSCSLSVPQLLTLIHVQGQQQRTTNDLVFPERDGMEPALSHPQGTSREGTAPQEAPPGKCLQIPHPGCRQQGAGAAGG